MHLLFMSLRTVVSFVVMFLICIAVVTFPLLVYNVYCWIFPPDAMKYESTSKVPPIDIPVPPESPLPIQPVVATEALSVGNILLISSIVLNILFLLYYFEVHKKVWKLVSGLATKPKPGTDAWTHTLRTRKQRSEPVRF